jgi:hypothetical protein
MNIMAIIEERNFWNLLHRCVYISSHTLSLCVVICHISVSTLSYCHLHITCHKYTQYLYKSVYMLKVCRCGGGGDDVLFCGNDWLLSTHICMLRNKHKNESCSYSIYVKFILASIQRLKHLKESRHHEISMECHVESVSPHSTTYLPFTPLINSICLVSVWHGPDPIHI